MGGLIFVIIVICIPILYCCIKSRSSQKKKFKLGEEEGEGDSIDDPFLMDLDKRHTKSELSIPYMDASLPPTPKGAGVDSVWLTSLATTTRAPKHPCQKNQCNGLNIKRRRASHKNGFTVIFFQRSQPKTNIEKYYL